MVLVLCLGPSSSPGPALRPPGDLPQHPHGQTHTAQALTLHVLPVSLTLPVF